MRRIWLNILIMVLLSSVQFLGSLSLISSTPGWETLASWAFDEGTGNTASDSSGNGNDGTLFGPTWVTRDSGYALYFDGVDDYVSIPILYGSSPSGIRLTAWIKSPLDREMVIFYHGDNGEFILSTAPGKVGFAVKLPNGTPEELYGTWYGAPVLTTANVWHQVVGEWIKGSHVKTVVDGTASSQISVPDKYLFDPGSYYYAAMGKYHRWDGWNPRYFKGTLDPSTEAAPPYRPIGVGGLVVSVDKPNLLAPYVGLTSTIIVATVATAIYVKRVKRRKERQ